MKKILIPTDFSPASAYGIDLAVSLAKRTGAKVYLFNAAETGSYYLPTDPLFVAAPAVIMIEGVDTKLKEAAIEKLNALKKNKIFSGVDVTVKCEISPKAHTSILDYADEIKADVIIMGTKGTSSIPGILLGSTAERVVRFSKRPVIVVPSKIKNLNLKRLVFASDFKEEAYNMFPVVQRFAKIFGSEINLLKVNTADRFSKTPDDTALINSFNKKFGGKYEYTIYNEFTKEVGILSYADEVKADIIAIGTHGKTGLRRFFSEDVSEGLVRLAHKPILVVNLNKDTN